MSNLPSDIKLIQSWTLKEIPSDFVQTAKTEWAIFCSANEYWSFNSNDKKASTKKASTELFKVEQANDAYFILSYNSEKRLNMTWQGKTLDLSSKEALPLDDAADIAYSSALNKLYWINQSRGMMVYDLASKQSTPFMEGQSASVFSTSANGKYLAVQGTDKNILLVDLSNDKILLDKKSESGQIFKLAGATDDGNLVLLQMNIIQKDGATPDNQVLCYSKDGTENLVSGTITWAAFSGKNLVTWGDKKVSVYEF